MPSTTSSSARAKPPVRLARSVPSAHNRVLDRIIREEMLREQRLALANLDSDRTSTEREMQSLAPGSRIALPRVRRRSPKRLTRARMQRFRETSVSSTRLVNAEVRREVARLRGMLREAVRAGQTRSQTVGDPTSFLCSLTAQAISTVVESLASNSGAVTITPIATQRAVARNRARFVANVFSPVEHAGSVLFVTQTTRFSFSVGIAGALTITGHVAPVGSYRIDAPSPKYEFPFFHIVPHPRIVLSCGIRVVETLPFPPGATSTTSVTRISPTTVLIDRTVSGWGGPRTEVGLLQSVSSPASVTVPPFVVTAGSSVTVDVGFRLTMFAQNGGTLLVDCLSNPEAGLNAAAVVLRLDY